MISLTGGFRLLVLIFLCSIEAAAQTTIVTGPIIDPSGNTWSVATVHAVFVPTPNVPGPYVWSGGAFNTNPPTVTTDAGGNFTLTLPSNTSITPSGSSWQIITGPNATTSAAIASVMLSGGSLDISTAYTAVDGWPTTRINPTPITTVYNTNQTLPPPTGQGGMVYNTTTQQMEIYTISGWVAFANAGGLPVITNPTGNQNIVQPGGTFFEINGNHILDTSTGVQLNPTTTQTIVQPTGTTLAVNSFNGIAIASQFAGVDIGAKINAAEASLGTNCGTVVVAPGTYSFATQIVKPRCMLIEGNNAVLTWTGTNPNLPAIVTGSVAGVDYTFGGIYNLKLVGNTLTPGIYMGGVVGSYSVPSGLSDYLEDFQSVTVTNFSDNYVKGTNVYQVTFIGGASTSGQNSNWNDVGVFGSENMNFFGWQNLNAAGYGFYSVNLAGSEYSFTDCSFDYNSLGAFNYINGNVRLKGGHLEQSNTAYFFASPASSSAFSLVLTGGVQFVSAAPLTAYIYVGGTNSDVFLGVGLNLSHLSAVTELVNWQALGDSNQLNIMAYADPLATAGITIPPVQAGANIQWLDVPTFTQYVPTDRQITSESIGFGSIGSIAKSGLVGSSNNGCASAIQGVSLPYSGNFLGWNCDGSGGADFYNPYILNTGASAFHWKTKLIDGTWTEVMNVSRGGILSVNGLDTSIYIPVAGTVAPTGSCAVAGQLNITADGHGTYCHSSSLVWTTLY